MAGRFTFGDGALNLRTLNDDVVVVEAFFLLNEVVAVAILVAGRRRVSLRRQLHARDKEPLHEREDDPDDGADRDHDLRRQVRKQRTPHLTGTLAPPDIRSPENAEPYFAGTERERGKNKYTRKE